MADDTKKIDYEDIDRSGVDGNIASEARIDLSKVERVEIDAVAVK